MDTFNEPLDLGLEGLRLAGENDDCSVISATTQGSMSPSLFTPIFREGSKFYQDQRQIFPALWQSNVSPVIPVLEDSVSNQCAIHISTAKMKESGDDSAQSVPAPILPEQFEVQQNGENPSQQIRSLQTEDCQLADLSQASKNVAPLKSTSVDSGQIMEEKNFCHKISQGKNRDLGLALTPEWLKTITATNMDVITDCTGNQNKLDKAQCDEHDMFQNVTSVPESSNEYHATTSSTQETQRTLSFESQAAPKSTLYIPNTQRMLNSGPLSIPDLKNTGLPFEHVVCENQDEECAQSSVTRIPSLASPRQRLFNLTHDSRSPHINSNTVTGRAKSDQWPKEIPFSSNPGVDAASSSSVSSSLILNHDGETMDTSPPLDLQDKQFQTEANGSKTRRRNKAKIHWSPIATKCLDSSVKTLKSSGDEVDQSMKGNEELDHTSKRAAYIDKRQDQRKDKSCGLTVTLLNCFLDSQQDINASQTREASQSDMVNASQSSSIRKENLALLIHKKEVESLNMLISLSVKLLDKLNRGQGHQAETQISKFEEILTKLRKCQEREREKLVSSKKRKRDTRARLARLEHRQSLLRTANSKLNTLVMRLAEVQNNPGTERECHLTLSKLSKPCAVSMEATSSGVADTIVKTVASGLTSSTEKNPLERQASPQCSKKIKSSFCPPRQVDRKKSNTPSSEFSKCVDTFTMSSLQADQQNKTGPGNRKLCQEKFLTQSKTKPAVNVERSQQLNSADTRGERYETQNLNRNDKEHKVGNIGSLTPTSEKFFSESSMSIERNNADSKNQIGAANNQPEDGKDLTFWQTRTSSSCRIVVLQPITEDKWSGTDGMIVNPELELQAREEKVKTISTCDTENSAVKSPRPKYKRMDTWPPHPAVLESRSSLVCALSSRDTVHSRILQPVHTSATSDRFSSLQAETNLPSHTKATESKSSQQPRLGIKRMTLTDINKTLAGVISDEEVDVHSVSELPSKDSAQTRNTAATHASQGMSSTKLKTLSSHTQARNPSLFQSCKNTVAVPGSSSAQEVIQQVTHGENARQSTPPIPVLPAEIESHSGALTAAAENMPETSCATITKPGPKRKEQIFPCEQPAVRVNIPDTSCNTGHKLAPSSPCSTISSSMFVVPSYLKQNNNETFGQAQVFEKDEPVKIPETTSAPVNQLAPGSPGSTISSSMFVVPSYLKQNNKNTFGREEDEPVKIPETTSAPVNQLAPGSPGSTISSSMFVVPSYIKLSHNQTQEEEPSHTVLPARETLSQPPINCGQPTATCTSRSAHQSSCSAPGVNTLPALIPSSSTEKVQTVKCLIQAPKSELSTRQSTQNLDMFTPYSQRLNSVCLSSASNIQVLKDSTIVNPRSSGSVDKRQKVSGKPGVFKERPTGNKPVKQSTQTIYVKHVSSKAKLNSASEHQHQPANRLGKVAAPKKTTKTKTAKGKKSAVTNAVNQRYIGDCFPKLPLSASCLAQNTATSSKCLTKSIPQERQPFVAPSTHVSAVKIARLSGNQNQNCTQGKDDFNKSNCPADNLACKHVVNEKVQAVSQTPSAVEPPVSESPAVKFKTVHLIHDDEICPEGSGWKDFWSENFSELRMTVEFWQSVDAW